jgi:ferredoxin, 2Fe-2S
LDSSQQLREERRMADLIVVDRDGVEHRVECKAGVSVMETLRELDYGVAAICGGMCSCATCHIYIDDAWRDKLPAPQPDEKELLQELSGYQPASRLSCQVVFEDSLSGLRVSIAPDE